MVQIVWDFKKWENLQKYCAIHWVDRPLNGVIAKPLLSKQVERIEGRPTENVIRGRMIRGGGIGRGVGDNSFLIEFLSSWTENSKAGYRKNDVSLDRILKCCRENKSSKCWSDDNVDSADTNGDDDATVDDNNDDGDAHSLKLSFLLTLGSKL